MEEDKSKVKPRRPRGSGSLFKTDRSRFWICGYRHNGRTVHESTKEVDRRRAEAFLRGKLTAVDDGTLPSRSQKDTTVDQLFALIEPNYELKRNRSFPRIEQQWRLHLKPELTKILGSDLRATKLTTDSLDAYILKRREQGASLGCVRNELALLRRMYRLGSEKAKIRFIPKFTLPGSYDDNTREVKFTDEEFERLESEVLRTSNFPLLVFIRAARNLGWRSGELRKMKVNQFEVADSVATLPRTGSKNKKARRIRLTKSMAAMFRALADGKSPDDLLFVIPDFYERWQQACIAAGLGELRCRRCGRATMPNTQKAKLPKVRGLCKARWCPTCAEPKGNREIMYEGRIPHDLRRTAATDMSNALVPDRVICDTVGFSVAMLKRYHIGDEEQTGRGQTQLEAWRKARAEERAAALTASKLSTTYEQPAPKAVQNAVPEKLVN